jgi:3-oxoacyl-[acyl-carrier protein] reductase
MTSTLQGKTALVTGGSRGIGRAICLKLASQGAHVFINYASRRDAADEVAALCQQLGASATVIGFNVGSSDEVEKGFEQIRSSAGRVDILVNNAGISKDGLMMRMKDEDWEQTLSVNLSGAFYCARAASRLMMKQRWGRIVNISSVVGEMGNAGQAPYVSSKAGLIGLTKAMARELSSRNITVNAVTPGFIETEMTEGLGESLRAEHLKAIPLGRYGSAEEVASLVTYLCAEDAGYITGQVIGVNGGMYM